MKDFERIDRLEKKFDRLLLAIKEVYNEFSEEGKDETDTTKNSRLIACLALQKILLKYLEYGGVKSLK